MKILFLGGPSSGKSTQGQILAEKKGWRWISSGELCRRSENVEILETIRGEKLIPDDIISKMVVKEIKSGDEKNFILDGFPRNRRQCEVLEEEGIKIDSIVEIVVPDEEIFNRANLRGREQDAKDVVEKRINMYKESRDVIFSFFKDKGVKIITIDGIGSIEEVAAKIGEAVV